jgi:(S)-ureidoglycine aminohydrolase
VSTGSYATSLVDTHWTFKNDTDAACRFHWIRKAYEWVDGIDAPRSCHQ